MSDMGGPLDINVIRTTNNTIVKRKATKGQTMVYKTLHINIKI